MDKAPENEASRILVSEPAATYGDPRSDAQVRHSIGALLHSEVAATNLDNFVVRPWRRVVERYTSPEAWTVFSAEALSEFAHEVASLLEEKSAIPWCGTRWP